MKGIDTARLEDLPLLEGAGADLKPGLYTVRPDEEEHVLEAEDPEYHFETWFQTPPLDAETIKRLHSVQLFAESHAQGFCSDESAGTWTWFEVAIMKSEKDTAPRIKDEVTLAWRSHKNYQKKWEYGWKAGKKFSENHDMFRLLEPGNVIAVRLAARFLGWAVYSRKGYLEIEIGEEVERKKLNYGQIVSTVNTVQEVFQDINSIMQPETMQISRVSSALFMAGMMSGQDKPPLRVLSLDGGGVRGIAALMLLDEVMKKSHPGKLPYQVFDMIGGTSTGGFIAIMLGRMKMSVSECIQAYTEFMNVVFPPRSKLGSLTAGLKSAWSGNKWKAEPLVDVIKRLIKAKLGDPEKLLLFDPAAAATDDNPCKVFLMAVNQLGANNHAPVTLRTYEHPLDKPALPEIKLWEACRATSAAPSYFPPLEVSGVKFLDGGLQANNPLGWLWNEVLTVFGPARDTSCFLSIGTGTPESQVAGSATAGGLIGFAKSMASIATNTEMVNILFRSLINAFAPRPQGKKYWRFNIGDGCPDWIEGPDGVWAWSLQEKRVEMDLGELDDVAAMDKTVKATKAYIALDGAQAMISECAKALVVA